MTIHVVHFAAWPYSPGPGAAPVSAALTINAAKLVLLLCHPRGDLVHMELFRASGHLRERVPRITKRPVEESWSGRLADFKWSSLAKRIIVGVHDRQSVSHV